VGTTYGVPFVASGVLGAVVTFFGLREYTRRVRAVAALGSPANGSGA
jgi:hypothetical protein